MDSKLVYNLIKIPNPNPLKFKTKIAGIFFSSRQNPDCAHGAWRSSMKAARVLVHANEEKPERVG